MLYWMAKGAHSMSNEKRARSLFAGRLRLLRKVCNMTQKQVAQSLSIDRSTYAYYETDKTKPDYETLLRIAQIFNVSIDYLLGRDQDETPPLLLHDGAMASKGADKAETGEKLTPDEQSLLQIYRQLDNIQKSAVKQFAMEQRYLRHQFRDKNTNG